MLTIQTEAEMIINTDLDSTLNPPSTCQFFLHGAYKNTRKELSLQTVKDISF